MLMARRSYWGVESGLHARLDVTAMEDKSRVRLRNNALNLALMRRAAVSIACAWMRQEPNARKANLPGFYDAVRSEVVGLLTEPPTRCSAFIT